MPEFQNGINKRALGARYERMAGRFLEEQGFRILAYNFRCRWGEIDLVAREGKTLAFVEVKYRTTERSGSPFEAVDVRKQQVICRCADFFRIRYGYKEGVPCRFDVVGIQKDEIRHIRNAFEYIPPGKHLPRSW